MFLEALSFGIAVAFILLGIAGIIVPILPGTILVWLTVLVYAWATSFATLTPTIFVLITLVALVTGSANLWLPLLGAQRSGAAKRALFLGLVGAIIGTFIVPLVGTIIGYALGILLGEFLKHQDLNLALRASLGGLAGWGVATMVELGGALLILVIFVTAVLRS